MKHGELSFREAYQRYIDPNASDCLIEKKQAEQLRDSEKARKVWQSISQETRLSIMNFVESRKAKIKSIQRTLNRKQLQQ